MIMKLFVHKMYAGNTLYHRLYFMNLWLYICSPIHFNIKASITVLLSENYTELKLSVYICAVCSWNVFFKTIIIDMIDVPHFLRMMHKSVYQDSQQILVGPLMGTHQDHALAPTINMHWCWTWLYIGIMNTVQTHMHYLRPRGLELYLRINIIFPPPIQIIILKWVMWDYTI